MAGRVIFMRGLRTSSKSSFGSSVRNTHSSSASSPSTSIPSSFFSLNSSGNSLPKSISSPSMQSRTSNLYKSAAQAYRHSVSSHHSHSLRSSTLSSPAGSFMRGISSPVSSSVGGSSARCGTATAGTTSTSAKGISGRGLSTATGSQGKGVSSASNGNSNAGESVSGTSDTGMDNGKDREKGQDRSFIDKGGGIDPGGGGRRYAGSSGSSASNSSRQKSAADDHAEQIQAAQAYGLGLLDAAARATQPKGTTSSSTTAAGSTTPPPSTARQEAAEAYDDRPEPASDPLQEEEERKRSRQASLFLLACSCMAGAATFVILGMPTPEDKPLPNESMWRGYFRRAKAAVRSWYTSFSDPISDKLLPDPLPEPYQRPYTMVIALNDCLVYSTWDKENGWRAAKRPYVDWFLSYMSQFYEIVVFTSGMAHVAHPIIEKLDPYRFIMYRLYRDSTRFKDNKFLKDLSVLNRDLGRTIIIDVNPDSYSLQPDNAIPLKKWTGEADDVELLRLIPFLEALAMSEVPDVRPILRSYQDRDIPSAWAEYQEKLRDEFEQNRKATQAANKPSGLQGLLTSLFGGGTRVVKVSEANPVDILQQQARQMREQFYKEQASMKEQLEEQRKFEEAEMERQLAAMKAKKLSLWEFMATAQPQPGQQQQQHS